MTLFWTVGATLAAVALLLLLRPLLFTRPAKALSRRDANVSIHRDQLRELEADLAAGKIAQADYARARSELEARLLEDVAVPDEAPARRGTRGMAIGLAAAVPILAVLVYVAIGSPAALGPQADPHGSVSAE